MCFSFMLAPDINVPSLIDSRPMVFGPFNHVTTGSGSPNTMHSMLTLLPTRSSMLVVLLPTIVLGQANWSGDKCFQLTPRIRSGPAHDGVLGPNSQLGIRRRSLRSQRSRQSHCHGLLCSRM